MQGKSAPLLSSFKLSYYTLLNLLRRIEGSGAFVAACLPARLLAPVAATGHWFALKTGCSTRRDHLACMPNHLPACLQVPTWSL